jgi:hypothetical protein
MTSTTIEDQIARLKSFGFEGSMIDSFAKAWKILEEDGYDMFAIYTGVSGSILEGKAGCIICSKNSTGLRWEKVITPSQDSAAIYCVCNDCDNQYVEAAIRQKALGRLLKERNTRPT